MKKFLIILFVMVAGVSACKKDEVYDVTAHAAEDDAKIREYLAANKISAVADPSSLYYTIVTPGNNTYPRSSSNITVSYVGKLLENGNTFDSNTSFTTDMSSVIRGWVVGLQHIGVGGTIVLYIPSTMAYQNVDKDGIPKNSVLIFTITLTSIN